jgi:Spy/CpxP family protein refolding chaperone
MKRILTGILAFVLLMGTAQAQTKDSTHRKAGKHHKEHRMDAYHKLDLTEEQKTKMKELKADFKKQEDELKTQENTLTAAQMKERRKALSQEYIRQYESILTKEQKEQVAQFKKEGKGRHGKGMKGRKHEAQKVEKDLDLTPDQQAKMKALREDFKTKAEAIRSNKSLDKEAQKKAFKQLHEENKAQMKSILTKEQLEKMDSGKGKRKEGKKGK